MILSGTASDGTLGLEAIKAEGGITFAQDASARYDSMPRNAIAAGCVDLVLSPDAMARELAGVARHPSLKEGLRRSAAHEAQGNRAAELPLAAEAAGEDFAHERGNLQKVLMLLREHTGVDFSLYKPRTIERRITRRMVLNKVETLEAYADTLRGNAKELEALYTDMLISVTSFFRNPQAFEILKRKVFPKMVEQSSREPVRVWVQGCSTGQEAYSIAMAFAEFAESAKGARKLQMFATDLNERLLEKARRGLYVSSLVQDVSPERLRRFFVEEPGGYQVSKPLRDQVVFARQNLLSDPPFSRLDLISCRNLLMYINPDLQNRVLSAFRYALKPGGFLFLGASESVGQMSELFEVVDKKLRIFARKPGVAPGWHRPVGPRALEDKRDGERGNSSGQPKGTSPELRAQREADRLLVNQFAPPGVIINPQLQILQFRGSTNHFLAPPVGKPSVDLLKMAREGLVVPLRTAIEQAKAADKTVRKEGVQLREDDGVRTLNLEVIPLRNLKERAYLVLFQEPGVNETSRRAERGGLPRPHGSPPEPGGVSAIQRRVVELQRELAETRDYLQSVQEQYETANEQLQVYNEEITSGNEELQSINEELETSKEELESSNEELTTINEELAGRNAEFNRLNAELNNLHTSINTPILVLGPDLSIRRFTPPAAKVFNLLAGDVGRVLGGVRHNLELPELEALLTEVIATGKPHQREVRNKEGHWFDLRARSYVTLDNRIDGVVLMLVDIDDLKRAEQQIREGRDFAEAVIESVPPLLILKQGLQVQRANAAFYKAFQVTPEQTEGRLVFALGNGQWNIPELRRLLEEILHANHFFKDYEVTHDFEIIGRRTMLLSGGRVKGFELIIVAIEDITMRKRAEEAARQAREVAIRYASDLEGFSYSLAHDMRAPLRAMQSFASLIELRDGERLSPESRDYLQRTKAATLRLDALIRDSLDYAKAMRQEVPLQPVDIGALLHDMLQTYPDLQHSQAELRIECDGVMVLGNEAGLTLCFSNLLDNAIKFVRPGSRPWVRVWAENRAERVRIWVEDRGIGIPRDAYEKIFLMFQRMHREDEYPGTGIGLALVRKMMQRMRGTVGVESAPGKGSKFWIELARGGRT